MKVTVSALVLALTGALVGAAAQSPATAQPADDATVAARAGVPMPFGRTCTADTARNIRFCPANGDKVPSFDGTPIDVDVTLPPTGSGPWPTIVLLHGLGGNKTSLMTNIPQVAPKSPVILPNLLHHNNVYFARRGYAVVNLSARGFGESCSGGGVPGSYAQTGACADGFVRLSDQRYEARDTQHLLGLLADQGITKPKKIGVTGFSYGGGMALQLGHMRDKIRRPNGDFAPWRSPNGTPMEIGAAYGQWGWTDLISSILPNGRFLDYKVASGEASKAPLGVMKQSYIRALLALATVDGYVVQPVVPGVPHPQGDVADWDLTSAVLAMEQGEPYSPELVRIVDEFRTYHGSVEIPGRPAPMLLQSGWNDDIFTPHESLRAYNNIRAKYPNSYVAMLLGDYGHGRDANKKRASLDFNNQASRFFDKFLRGVGTAMPSGSVKIFNTTCPAFGPNAPRDGGPYQARSWKAIHPFRLTFGGAATQRIDSAQGDNNVGQEFDPIPQTNPRATNDPCKTIPAAIAPGTATYSIKLVGGVLLQGLPVVRATIQTTGANGQIAGRLWHVNKRGQQRLISRGVYRLTPNQTGRIAFQLNGNGYRIRKGHTVKLELAPSDAPMYRASNGAFTVDVSDVRVRLPIRLEYTPRPN